jgi:hypothetical protein
MAMIRTARFTTDAAQAGEMLARRAELIRVVREAFPGLTEARLARLGEDSWVDIWRWESAASMQTATAGAHDLPETAAAFALTRNLTAEDAEVIDER